jgi:hypothetical protein
VLRPSWITSARAAASTTKSRQRHRRRLAGQVPQATLLVAIQGQRCVVPGLGRQVVEQVPDGLDGGAVVGEQGGEGGGRHGG